MVRGLVVGLGVFVVTLLLRARRRWRCRIRCGRWRSRVLGSAILGTLGLIAGISADKFDQLAAFQNFLIMPLTFLSGVFYSIHSLPPFWQALSHFNPFFYMIDGFRYGFFGLSDVRAGTEPRARRNRGADSRWRRIADARARVEAASLTKSCGIGHPWLPLIQ